MMGEPMTMLDREQALQVIMAERQCGLAQAVALLEQFMRERPDAWSPTAWSPQQWLDAGRALQQQADKLEAELSNKQLRNLPTSAPDGATVGSDQTPARGTADDPGSQGRHGPTIIPPKPPRS